MTIQRRGVWLLLALCLSAPSVAEAQISPRRPPPPPRVVPKRSVKPARPPGSPNVAPSSLKARQGYTTAARLIRSIAPAERVRGFERLGDVGTPAAMELLGKSLEPGGAAKRFEERLTVVRALAMRASQDGPRQALARAMASSSTGRADDPGEVLVRDTAALALARTGDERALEILGKALRQEGPIAAAAARAILAHPPKNLGPVLTARGAPTRTLVEVLDALGDQRAFATLRSWVKHGSPELKGRAAVALTRLGDYETVELARLWLAKHAKEAPLAVAATSILLSAGTSDAGRALSALLKNEETSDAGLELSRQSRNAELLPLLTERLAKADDTGAPLLLGAIGRVGTPRAAERLFQELGSPRHGAAAAYALATCPGSDARALLARALGKTTTRRNAARAAVVREAVLGERVPDLDAALRALIVAGDAADRAAGAWGIATRNADDARALLGRADPVVVRAAARAALDERSANVAAERLANETDPLVRVALAISLVRESSARRVPTSVVLELVEGGGGAAAIAAKALATRDGESERPQIERLAQSGDPLIRAHVALGLGESKEPSAVGLLGEMYRFEQDADVRHAVVVALSRRTDRTRQATLRLAAELDGDERARSAARLALRGTRLSALPRGRSTLWLSLVDGGAKSGAPPEARIGTSSGASLPVVADPDGAIVMTGLPEGPLTLRLAADAGGGKP